MSAASALASEPAPAKKTTYEDDVLPIFRDNCLKCHNPDKLKGDLDLTSFSNTIKGGGSGVTLNAGDPDGSLLFKSVTHSDEPTMPPNGKLAERDIATIRRWIEGGLLQGANSKSIAANKPAVDLSIKSVSVGKPEGPPPMPGALPLEPAVIATHGSPLGAIAHSPWAPVVALTGAKQISLYNTRDLEFAGVLPFPEGIPCDVKFSRNGKLLLAGGGRGGHSGLVVVWDIATGQRVITVGDQFDSVLAADLSSDQRWIALGGPDKVLKIYNTRDGALEHRIKKHTDWVTAIEFSPNAKYLATGDRNGGVVLWEAESGQEMFSLAGHKGGITAVTWRGDSEIFCSASEDGTLKLWKASDGSAVRNIAAHPGGILAAHFTHGGQIVSSGRDNKVKTWDVAGKNLSNLPFKGDLPNRVAFNEDGSRILVSDWRGSVSVWDVKNTKSLGELEANPPTLAERVQRNAEQLAKLKAQLTKASQAATAAAEAAKTTQAALKRAQQSLAEARTAGTGVEAAQKEVDNATKQHSASAKKIAEAKKTVADLTPQVATAEAALAKWQTALDATRAQATKSKVTLR
ncbi:MAG: c-type cytochrome domain-containing protein [Verrucomicrobiota bacterium]